jgi:hypothetical protein
MEHSGWIVVGVVVAFIMIALLNSVTGKKNQVEFASVEREPVKVWG